MTLKIKQNIIYGLGTFAILVFGMAIMPVKTNAQVSSYLGGTPVDTTYYQPSQNQIYYSNNYQPPIYVQPQPVVLAPAPTPTIYSNTTNPNTATAPKTVAKIKTAPVKNTDNSLTASAISAGEDSFLPSGLIQWIFFAILVLLIVILVRKVFGSDKNYHSTPLKQA